MYLFIICYTCNRYTVLVFSLSQIRDISNVYTSTSVKSAFVKNILLFFYFGFNWATYTANCGR